MIILEDRGVKFLWGWATLGDWRYAYPDPGVDPDEIFHEMDDVFGLDDGSYLDTLTTEGPEFRQRFEQLEVEP